MKIANLLSKILLVNITLHLALSVNLRNDSNIKIWCRNNVIPESLLGKRILIHNGNSFKRVLIVREKIGFKFGDFCITRKYSKKVAKLKKKKN